VNKPLTLEQIAKLAGVSRTTASRVLNGRPGVSVATRERVLKVMDEVGYEPNENAQSLAARRSREGSREEVDPAL
jgi:LacI family transcriptional regulator